LLFVSILWLYAICATRIFTLEWYSNGRKDDK
jgi:hypothetical protein